MWKYGFASVAGTAHARLSLPVQDASRAEIIGDERGEEILLAVASAGAGSATQGQIGSSLACDLFIEAATSHFKNQGDFTGLSADFSRKWIEQFQHLVSSRADQDALRIQDFACTILAAVIGREQAVYFQLGDGAMVVAQRHAKDHYDCVCWPQQGEYANTTHFLTDADAAAKIFRKLNKETVDEIALFTDGLQGLVLDYRRQSAHSPFFASLCAWLRPHSAGYSAELSTALVAYLNSEKINARTDDDKTLILATRRQP